MVNWSRLPDVIATSLLAFAFASILRRNRAPGVNLWLFAWLLIIVHFVGAMFVDQPGALGFTFNFLVGAGLVIPALIFTWSTVPHRERRSSKVMLGLLLVTNMFCLELVSIGNTPRWLMDGAAVLLGLAPLLLTILLWHKERYPVRLISVIGSLALCIFLLVVEHRGTFGLELAQNAILTTLYLTTTLFFWWVYGFRTAGATITVSGFVAWFMVFPVSILLEIYAPAVHIESEIWNLPKYVVAAGMLLLLLEDQIEHTRHLALHDVLTGLPNRRFFVDSLDRTIAQARRSQTRVALLSVDLDDFKRVNDTLGHHIGDDLLRSVADIFSARIRKSDVFARTGGDEFTILLQEPVTRESAEALACQLAELLHEPVLISGHSMQAGASIGVALFPDDALEADALCIAADQQMYQVKGQSRTHYFPIDTAQGMQPSKPCLGEL